MNIENYFEQQKGITVDSARQAGAKYTAIDMCKFAKKYNEEEKKTTSLSSSILKDYCLPESLNNPEFEKRSKVHDWRNYVPGEFIEDWDNLTLREKQIIYIVAEKQADLEEWD